MTNEEKLIELGYEENTLYFAVMNEETPPADKITEDVLVQEMYSNTGNIDCYDLQNFIWEMNTNGFDPMAEVVSFMFSKKDGIEIYNGYITI